MLCSDESKMIGTEDRHDEDGQLQSPAGSYAEVLIVDSPSDVEPLVGETVLLELADLLPDDSGVKPQAASVGIVNLALLSASAMAAVTTALGVMGRAPPKEQSAR